MRTAGAARRLPTAAARPTFRTCQRGGWGPPTPLTTATSRPRAPSLLPTARSVVMAAAAAADSRVYVVIVTGKLQEGCLPQFLENFKPLAKYVTEHEPGALSYQLSLDGNDDPNRLCIFERYISKDYLENVHWKSPAFNQFRESNEQHGIVWEVKEVIKYYETDVGFMVR